uniref:Uncharacterized protein n=1 Tax=Amphimedon queenslandica TaxID=400682 RepID=A0A1X7TYY7_AMPQE
PPNATITADIEYNDNCFRFQFAYNTPHNINVYDPVNETVLANLSYTPGVLAANYTYLTPHDESIPHYRVFLFQTYPGFTYFASIVAGRMHRNTTLPPVESFNVTLTTTMKYLFLVMAINKYMKHDVQLVTIRFTLNEENEIV